MSVLLFGVSHRSAPVSVLEQLSTDESDQAKIIDQVLQSSLVTEAMVLSTCNRSEVYVVAEKFHPAYADLRTFFSELAFVPPEELAEHLYDSGNDRDPNAIEVIVARLRRKLGNEVIETRRGFGYRVAGGDER